MKYPGFIFGYQEWVTLPLLNVPAIRAKLDTGAKTSSIHAYNIEYSVENGVNYICFELHPIQHSKEIIRLCRMPVLDHRLVRSSSGDAEERPVIRTILALGGKRWEIDLNLTNRDYMGFRLLIGREALSSMGLVHPGAKYLHGRLSDKRAILKYS